MLFALFFRARLTDWGMIVIFERRASRFMLSAAMPS